MMYTIVALAYLITANVPPDEPLPFTSKHTFVGLDKCQEYLKSAEFMQERQSLYMTLGRTLAIQSMADESKPMPSIAITASCQEDNRL